MTGVFRNLHGADARGGAVEENRVSTAQAPAAIAPDLTLAALERRRIDEVLRSAGGNKSAAARILGISRRALYRRIDRYDL